MFLKLRIVQDAVTFFAFFAVACPPVFFLRTMSLLPVSSSSLDALIKPSQLPGSFSLTLSGLFPSSENPHRTTFPNQFSSTSFLHCTSPPNTTSPSKEVLLRSLQDILHPLQFEDKTPPGSAPLVPCTTKYANASSLPISGYLAIVHLDASTPGLPPTSSLLGPFLIVHCPTAFSFNNTPISSQAFENAPETYSQGQFPFPTSTLAPAFSFLSGHSSNSNFSRVDPRKPILPPGFSSGSLCPFFNGHLSFCR